MASTSTMNTWLDELGQSFLSSKGFKANKSSRRLIDTFRRHIRHHTFVRTNQFDVEERLSGLEEKFQILARDDLSNALYDCRVELKDHEQRWIPDVLDLLLRLSRKPLGTTSILDQHDLESHASTSPPLRWVDIASEDNLDLDDQLWKKPVFSDLSSDEDSAESSAESASVDSIKDTLKKRSVNIAKVTSEPFEFSSRGDEDKFLDTTLLELNGKVTEIQLMRECLFMVQGYPTALFNVTNGQIQLKPHIYLLEVNRSVIQDLLLRMFVIRSNIDVVRKWSQEASPVVFMQVLKQELSEEMTTYLKWINGYIEQLLHPKLKMTASILQAVSEVEDNARVLSAVSSIVRTFRAAGPVRCIDLLYEAVCQYCLFETEPVVDSILHVFIKALHAYILPILDWLCEGRLVERSFPSFIQAKTARRDTGNLWQEWYGLVESTSPQVPVFLSAYIDNILACGKTSAFLRLIAQDLAQDVPSTTDAEFENFTRHLRSAADESRILFPVAFNELLRNYLQTALSSRTAALKMVLESRCGLKTSLDAIEYMYLRRDEVITDNIESKIFPRIDHCVNTWNDRFLVADMFEDYFSSHDSVNAEAIIVHSAHTSSRSMESRRRSVRILAALAIEYILPWPVANIISRESMAAYRKVALLLTQIRRARYTLERVAHGYLQQHPISESSINQRYAQAVVYMFLLFANTVYDHLTTSIINPLTVQMRKGLEIAPTIDQMIASHASYITKLEFACLTAKKVSFLKDTLIGLLDMCIRLTDLICSPSSPQRRGSDDIEASSFTSAQSIRRHRLRNEQDTDTDDDESEDNVEGYSTFIILDDDTTIIKEMKKLETQFRRQLDFFVAGLRGVGKSGGDVMDEFEILAGRLEWKQTTII